MDSKGINKLSINEQLAAIENPLIKPYTESLQEQLKNAADLLLSDYTNDKELTVFCSLDF